MRFIWFTLISAGKEIIKFIVKKASLGLDFYDVIQRKSGCWCRTKILALVLAAVVNGCRL